MTAPDRLTEEVVWTGAVILYFVWAIGWPFFRMHARMRSPIPSADQDAIERLLAERGEHVIEVSKSRWGGRWTFFDYGQTTIAQQKGRPYQISATGGDGAVLSYIVVAGDKDIHGDPVLIQKIDRKWTDVTPPRHRQHPWPTPFSFQE